MGVQVRCGFEFVVQLAKIITASCHIFVVTCAAWCDLEFSQNHNHTAPHFCGHIYSAVYKMHFEVSIFFKF